MQGVIVAKDKSGAYVPKKYIVKRHGSGYLNGSTEWLNDALDGDYQRLVTENGLAELSEGKSVHKDFTAKSISEAFHLDALPKFLREYDSLVLKGTKEMLSDGSFRWRVPAFNRDMELVTEGRKALVVTGGSSTAEYFYSLDENGKFSYSGFARGDAHKIKERLFNGELLLADEEFISDEHKRIVTLGEEYRKNYAAEIARDALTKRNISEIYLSEEGELCARGLKGVSNGVNSYPSFVKGITVSTRTLYDSKAEVLDMSKCAGLKSFEIYEAARAYRKKLPSLSLIFPKELYDEDGFDSCNIKLNVESEELKFINFPKGAVFNKLSIECAKITGIDGAIKVAYCDIRECTGLSELSIEVSANGGERFQAVTLANIDTVKLSVIAESFDYCDMSLANLKSLRELKFKVSGEKIKLYAFTTQYMGFHISCGGLETLVLESKEGFLFNCCTDFASVYSSIKRLEIRGDIPFGSNVEDEVIFVPKGCKVVCDNAEFMKHVRER